MNSNGASRNLRILVVDDDVAVAKAVSLMLEFLGHQAQLAGNAQECLNFLSNAQFDLVFTDYDMPGMKGNELAATLKRLYPALPVAMLTAYVDILPPFPGVDIMIAKPFQLRHLREAISKLVIDKHLITTQEQGRGQPS